MVREYCEEIDLPRLRQVLRSGSFEQSSARVKVLESSQVAGEGLK